MRGRFCPPEFRSPNRTAEDDIFKKFKKIEEVYFLTPEKVNPSLV
jgi:hypothetical protein